MAKCEHCGKKGQSMIDISNYVVKYKSWEAYNCCCKECAKQEAMLEFGITEEDIERIE